MFSTCLCLHYHLVFSAKNRKALIAPEWRTIPTRVGKTRPGLATGATFVPSVLRVPLHRFNPRSPLPSSSFNEFAPGSRPSGTPSGLTARHVKAWAEGPGCRLDENLQSCKAESWMMNHGVRRLPRQTYGGKDRRGELAFAAIRTSFRNSNRNLNLAQPRKQATGLKARDSATAMDNRAAG
jgi:hypothetical protein